MGNRMGNKMNIMTDNVADSAIKFGAGRYRQGRGVLERCGQEIRRFGKKAYIIAGPRAFAAVKDRLLPGLTEAGLEYVTEIYDGVCSYEAAEILGKKCLDTGCDEVVGIGGGVIMDLSKAAAASAGLGVVNIPTSIATCAAFTAMSVMYTPQGAMRDNWRYEYETDGVYVDLDVISRCPARYATAGILDAMAKKIEIPNGRSFMEPDEAEFDLYTAYRMSEYAYDMLERYGTQAIGDIRQGKVTKAVEYAVFINIAVTGVVANITRSLNQSALAHMIYYGIRTCFTGHARQALHGEIVAVGLFAQLRYNCMGREKEKLAEFMRHLDMPLSLRDLGVDETEENLLLLEQYLADSPYVEKTEKGLGRLHESMGELCGDII